MSGNNIQIGPVAFPFSSEDAIVFDKCLDPFLTTAACRRSGSSCELSIINSHIKLAPCNLQLADDTVFETEYTWGLYRKQNSENRIQKTEFILAVPSLKSGENIQLIAEFDRGFRHGTVHINKSGAHFFLYPFLEVLTINLLGMGNGVLLHASCVDDNGKGYLFVGQSGAGKSTMADLWNGREGVRVLSDDRVIVQGPKLETQNSKLSFVAYGTPWHGTANYAMNVSVPIEKIFLIRHAEKNSAVPVKGMRPITRLIRDSFLPFWDRDKINYSIEFIEQIARNVDLIDLGFIPGEEAVNFIKNM